MSILLKTGVKTIKTGMFTIVLKHGKYLCAKFLYNLTVGIIELSCVFLWLLGKFMNVEIDTFCLSTSEGEIHYNYIKRQNDIVKKLQKSLNSVKVT